MEHFTYVPTKVHRYREWGGTDEVTPLAAVVGTRGAEHERLLEARRGSAVLPTGGTGVGEEVSAGD